MPDYIAKIAKVNGKAVRGFRECAYLGSRAVFSDGILFVNPETYTELRNGITRERFEAIEVLAIDGLMPDLSDPMRPMFSGILPWRFEDIKYAR